ncbi:hypothetical protein BDB00DRAFT_111643 [Zychaea mexicana]|uniref:uncharacterized protein n=1 Tax=Zychaea mexicana TaxID=64656 RepID=UPI0022FE7CC6|nr:uncharacterized protein BDB00DRAFT_111643 [Zychaea mexicana]KAI9484805.1 hypothetical protein BDB00DRAFT_111643 [Zychaea mexicana]
MTGPKKPVVCTDHKIPLNRTRSTALLASKDTSCSVPQPPPMKQHIAAAMYNDSFQKKAKKRTVYCCPYKFCTKSYQARAWLFKHIRKEHYAAFPECKPSIRCIFLTNSGKIIDFKEKSRGAVVDGEEIYSEPHPQ